MLIWVNGEACDQLHATDRGLAYGDGLFETIKVVDAKPLRLERHLARLAKGCRRLLLPIDLESITQELEQFAKLLVNGVMKLTVTRGCGQRGYTLPQPTVVTRILQGSALPNYPIAHFEQGVVLFACQTRLAAQPLLAGLKHLNRLEQVLARAEWSDPAYAEGLLCDYQGNVIEGVFSNVFIVKDGQLLTPLLDQCGVAGIMRSAILEQAQRHSIPYKEANISIQALKAADEVFVCNSLYGIWPVKQWGQVQWAVGPLTRRLQSLINTPLD